MTLPLRQRLIAAAAFATALGTGYVASLPDDEALAIDAGAIVAPARGGAAGSAGGSPADRLATRGDWAEPTANALAAWGDGGARGSAALPPAGRVVARTVVTPPQPAAAPVAAASAPPRAPQPPWRFVGRIADGERVQALLVTPLALRVVVEAEQLDADWRVEQIGEQAVELLWLPGAQRVRLAWVNS